MVISPRWSVECGVKWVGKAIIIVFDNWGTSWWLSRPFEKYTDQIRSFPQVHCENPRSVNLEEQSWLHETRFWKNIANRSSREG